MHDDRGGEDLDELITVPEVPCTSDPVVEGDTTIRLRTKTKRFFFKEAYSPRPLALHWPHNPYCDFCRKANMRQQTYSRSKERKNSGLAPLTGINQRLSADMIIAQRSTSEAPKGGPAIAGIEKPISFGTLD